jgi:twitching motility two-component system response regulator PilG
MSSYFSETPPGDLQLEEPRGDDFAPGRPRRPTIMVIDDSAAVRTVIQIAFRRVGVDVSAFEDGLSAMKALTREDVPVPSVLLLDLGLPRMNGYEVAALLRAHEAFKQTVLLMLTARDGVIDRVRAKMVGAQGYITKPFRVASVVQEVSRYLDLRAPGQGDQGYPGMGASLR